jgi:metal-responsive CopG/Arc/MetJ family transcriptional regulator
MKKRRVTVLMPDKIYEKLKSVCDDECVTITQGILDAVKTKIFSKRWMERQK